MTLRADDDAEGCKDSPLITRFPGSTLSACEHKEFDQQEVTLHAPNGQREDKKLEGEISYWQYRPREGVTALQMSRNVQAAVKKGGFETDFAADADIITAHKGDTYLYFQFYDNSYNQYVIKVKPMEQEITADAGQLQAELEKTGHVVAYGIHFDTGKATILPDSEAELNAIMKLLQNNPELKVSINGHTDNQGAKAANQALSQQRAQAVLEWLVAHGIDASRLKASGFGDTQPVADNRNDEGRAKNRRVELVKR